MAGTEDNATEQSIASGWDRFNTLGTTERYLPGTQLYQQGTPARYVYLIRDGVIKLSHSHQDGREVILGLSDRDRILGAATVILQRPHPVTAVTVTPCSIRSVSAQDFLQLIKTDPQFSFHLHRILCGEIYQQGARLADLSLLTARERLERLLDELVLIKDIGNVPDEVAPGLHLRHWELAELIAVTPEHLSRLLKLMHRDRNVAQENATLKVRNQRNVA